MSRLRSQLDNLMAQQGQNQVNHGQYAVPHPQSMRAYQQSDPGLIDVQRQLDSFGGVAPMPPHAEPMRQLQQQFSNGGHQGGNFAPATGMPYGQTNGQTVTGNPPVAAPAPIVSPQPVAGHGQPALQPMMPQAFTPPPAPMVPATVQQPQVLQNEPAFAAPSIQPVHPSSGAELNNIKTSLDRLAHKLQSTLQTQGMNGADSVINAQRAANEAFLSEVRSEFGKLAQILDGMQRAIKDHGNHNPLAQELGQIGEMVRQLIGQQAANPDQTGYLIGEIQNLKLHVENLGAYQAPPVDLSPIHSELTNSFAALGGRLEMIGSDQEAVNQLALKVEQSHAELVNRLDQIVASTPSGDNSELSLQMDALHSSMEPLPASIQDLNRQVSDISNMVMGLHQTSTSDQSQELHSRVEARLDEITRGIVALSASGKEDGGELERIEARVSSLAKTVDKFVAGGAVSASGGDISVLAGIPQEVRTSLAAFEARLDDIANSSLSSNPVDVDGGDFSLQNEILASLHSLETKVSEIGSPAAPTDNVKNVSMVAGEVSAFSDHVQNAFNSIETQIAALATNKSADFDGLASQINRLSERLDELTAVPLQNDDHQAIALAQENSAVYEKLDDLARRIDVMSVQLGDQADSIRADVSSDAPADTSAFSAIEAQLREMAAGLDGMASQPANLAPLEEQLTRIEHGLTSNRDATFDVASKAAQSAANSVAQQTLDAVAAQMSAVASTGADGGSVVDPSVLQSLANDIRGLAEHANSQSATNLDAFENVQQALSNIVDRISGIEEQIGSASAQSIESMALLAEQSQASVQQIERAVSLSQAHQIAQTAPAVGQYSEMPGEIASVSDPIDTSVGAPVEHEYAVNSSMEAAVSAPSQSLDFGMAPPPIPDHPVEAPIHSDPENFNQLPEVDAAPNMQMQDYSDMSSVHADTPLEPGSGVPSEPVSPVSTMVDRAEEELVQNDPGGSDFLARARRAAQAAAREANELESDMREAKPETAKSKAKTDLSGFFARKNKIVLVAAAAVFVAALAIPLAMNFLGGGSGNQPTVVAADAGADQRPDAAELAVAPATDAETSDVAANTDAANQSETGASNLLTAPSADEVAGNSFSSQSETIQPAGFGQNESRTVGNQSSQPLEIAAEPVPVVPDAVGNLTLRQAAADENPAALFEIARRYTDGVGVDRDLVMAAKWYELSASRDYGPAQYRLGNFFEKGHGVERDMAKAAMWYEQAAEKGNALAMHNLAVINATGVLGTAPNMETAVEWFTKAAERGVKDSQVNLGILYTRGMGVDVDTVQAYKWFALAAQAGDSDASSKRDTVANAMRPEQLDKARAEVGGWKPTPVDQTANSAVIPDTWKNTATQSAGLSTKDMIKTAQEMLSRQGYDPGPSDGVMGAKTRNAIMAFQQRSGLSVDGQLTAEVLNKLQAEAI